MVLTGLLGFVIGTLGTMVGIGGGSLFVPLLMLLYSVPIPIAVGTSLLVVFVNAVSGTLAYAHKGLIDYRSGFLFAALGLPGAGLGTILTKYIAANIFTMIFSLLLICLSLTLLLPEKSRMVKSVPEKTGTDNVGAYRLVKDRQGNLYSYRVPLYLGCVFSFFIGFVSNTLGIGGGVILVPVMIVILGIPVHIAVATSYLILVISSFIGASIHWLDGNVNFSLALGLAMGSILGGQIGVILSTKVPSKLIKMLLALILLGVGLKLTFSMWMVS